MNDLLVVMGCTKQSGLQPMYLSQLQEAGIKHHVMEMVQASDCIGDTLATLVIALSEFPKVEYFVFTDAWDVLFYGSKEDALSKIKRHGILMAAERNCYPDHTLAPIIKGPTAWRFANGGMIAGHRDDLLQWVNSIKKSPLYMHQLCNQGLFNQMLSHGYKLSLDAQTELFYCLFQEKDELQFENGMPVNKVLGTRPNFVHFNGKSPVSPILERRDRSLGKPGPDMSTLMDVQIPVMVQLKLCRKCGDRVLQGN